jgi:peptide deformylase
MLKLLPDTDPILRQVAEPVTEFNDELGQLCQQLVHFMKQHRGIGLAAPQVGISKRIIVANNIVLINPQIVATEGEYKFKEGCLTFPDLFLEVKRAQKVTVQYKDVEGNDHEATAQNIAAVVVQHEIDHLDGKLFIDYVKPLTLALARKNMKLK